MVTSDAFPFADMGEQAPATGLDQIEDLVKTAGVVWIRDLADAQARGVGEKQANLGATIAREALERGEILVVHRDNIIKAVEIAAGNLPRALVARVNAPAQ